MNLHSSRVTEERREDEGCNSCSDYSTGNIVGKAVYLLLCNKRIAVLLRNQIQRMPNDKKAKELTEMAMERTMKEFFHLCN